MAERDITLRLGVKPDAKLADPLKRIADASRSAGQDVSRLDNAFKRLSATTVKLGADGPTALARIAGQAKTAGGEMTAWAAATDKVAAATGKLAKQAGGKGGSTELGKLTGIAQATAALGVTNVLGDLVDDIVNVREQLGHALEGKSGEPGPKVEGGLLSRTAVGLLKAGGRFFGLTQEDERRKEIEEKAAKQLERQRDIREESTAQAQKVFEIQGKLTEAVERETKTRLDALQREREELREKAAASREFGLLNPLEQLEARSVARRLAAGQGGSLTGEELRFAGGISALRPAVERFAEERAAKSPIFQEILRLRPAVRPEDLIEKDIQALKLRAAESARAVQARVAQQITVIVQQDGRTVADQIAKVLLPKLLEENQKTEQTLRKLLADALANLRAGSRAMFGISKQP